jgi:hypothetical protein
LGEDAWTLILSNGRTVGNTRGTRSLTSSYCVANTLLQVVKKLGLSFSSTKDLNEIIDKALPGHPPFETHNVTIGDESLELHFRNLFVTITPRKLLDSAVMTTWAESNISHGLIHIVVLGR